MPRPSSRLRCPGAPVALGLFVLLSGCGAPEEGVPRGEASRAEPVLPRTQTKGTRFVRREVCAECHPGAYREWSGSHHDRAMQEANASTVLGDFAGATFTRSGVTSRFSEREGSFYVYTEGPDGRMQEYEIAYTFGFEPLQQYLVAFPGGRLQALTIAWDTRRKRWLDLYPDERIGPDDPLHWTARAQNWNAICAECHSTDLRKGYDAETDTYATTWVEIDVSCQACHGPGAEHVRWARGRADGSDDPATGLRVRLATADPAPEIEACAPCHSRRHRVSPEDEHGRPFLQDFMPELLREGLYHPDGQILEEVYVYGSFVQSRMFARGVRCSDCHDPHSLALRAEGDALCMQCHGEHPPERFPTLVAKRYDAPSHHFHPPGSGGARCVACHMPARTYMQIDARRDHGFRVPRPDLSLRIGTPNACNGCHADRPADWAVGVLRERAGPGPVPSPHWGETIAAGRAGDPAAELDLIALARDRSLPAIVRASALELLRGYGPGAWDAIAAATGDSEPLVRAAAAGGLDRLPPEPRIRAGTPLLTDPYRVVRVEAGRVLASGADGLAPSARAVLDAALAEFEAMQRAEADQPSAHLNLGVLHTALGELERAERSYRQAMEMDPTFLPARVNLANLYNAMGRNADAEGVLREAIERAPDQGELHYSLGLLLAEDGRIEEALEPLGRAAEFLPDRGRVRYNYALGLQHAGRRDEAERELMHAHRLDARDPAILQALMIFYLQEKRWDEARVHADRLAELVPDDPGLRAVLRRIEAEQVRENDAP